MTNPHPVTADNLRKLAKQFYRIAYRHLFEQRDPHSPIVNAYYEWLRKLNGIRNPFDIMEQNELEASIFIFLFEHNLLFQLTVLGRFDLIQILWREGRLSEKDRFYLNSMIDELIRNNQHYTYNYKMLKPDNLNSLMHIMNASYSVINFQLYCGLYEEYQRQSFKYNVEQSELYQKGLDDLIKITSKILKDPRISKEVRLEMNALHQQLINNRLEIGKLKDKNTLYQKNKPNLDAALKLASFTKDAYVAATEKIEASMSRHQDLKTKYEPKVREIQKNVKAKVESHTKKYEAIFKNLEERLEQLRKEVAADKGKIIEGLINILTTQIYPNLNLDQKATLKNSIKDLENLGLALDNATDPTTIKEILSQCSKTLQEIIATTQTVPQLASETTLLKKMHETFTELAEHQVTEQAYVFADKVNAVPIDIKAEIQTIREEQHPAIKDTLHTQQSEVITISERFQERLKETITKLEECLEEIKIQEPDDDTNAMIQAIEDIIQQLQADNYTQIKKTEANQILEYTDKLNKIYSGDPVLHDVNYDLKTIVQSFESPAQTPSIM